MPLKRGRPVRAWSFSHPVPPPPPPPYQPTPFLPWVSDGDGEPDLTLCREGCPPPEGLRWDRVQLGQTLLNALGRLRSDRSAQRRRVWCGGGVGSPAACHTNIGHI